MTAFTDQYGPLAYDIAGQTGLQPSVVLAIIDHETGGGQHIPNNSNNPFGMMDGKGQPRSYLDQGGAGADFVNLMKARYAPALKFTDPVDQAQAIANLGYGPGPADAAAHPDQAAGPGYASALIGKARQYHQAGFVNQPPMTVDQAMDLTKPPASPAPTMATPTPPTAPTTEGPLSVDDAMERTGSQRNAGLATTPDPAPPPPSGAGPNLMAGAAEGVAGLINVMHDPFGNLIGKPLVMAGGFVHDALAPYLGYKRFTPEQRADLLTDSYPQPGTASIDKLATMAGVPRPDQVQSSGTFDTLVRKATAGAVGGAVMGPFGAASMAGGAIVGDRAAAAAPDWAKPAVEMGTNILTSGGLMAMKSAGPRQYPHQYGGGTPEGRADAYYPDGSPLVEPRGPDAPSGVMHFSVPTDYLRTLRENMAAMRANATPVPSTLVQDSRPGGGNMTAIMAAARKLALARGETLPSSPTLLSPMGPAGRIAPFGTSSDGPPILLGGPPDPQGELPFGQTPQGPTPPTTPPPGPTPPGPVPDEPFNSVGAAATPRDQVGPMPPDPKLIARQAEAARLEHEQNLLTQPASARVNGKGWDTTQYVEGSVPSQAEYTGDSGIAIRQRADLEHPDQAARWQGQEEQNGIARKQFFQKESGSAPTLLQDKLNLAEQFRPRYDNLWLNEKPVASNLVSDLSEHINGVMAGPDGKMAPVKSALKTIEAKLHVGDDPTAALETSPEQLFGVRQEVTRLLGATARRADPNLADPRVSYRLNEIKEHLDDAIESGARGYKQVQSDYAQQSIPIDKQELLQGYAKDLYNDKGAMTLHPVQNMLEDIVTQRGMPGANQAKSLTNGDMSKLFDLRNDLQRRANIDLGKARGSNTAQTLQTLRALLPDVVYNGLSVPAHMALNHLVGDPMLNYMVGAAQTGLEGLRMARLAATERGKRVDTYLASPPGWNQTPPVIPAGPTPVPPSSAPGIGGWNRWNTGP